MERRKLSGDEFYGERVMSYRSKVFEAARQRLVTEFGRPVSADEVQRALKEEKRVTRTRSCVPRRTTKVVRTIRMR